MNKTIKSIKKIAVLFSLCFIGTIQAQWSLSGDKLYTTTNNVGIGTANPLSKLDVNGNIQISNASIPMGLMTEVLSTTPLLNMSVNFREANKNTAYIGAAFRIDTRSDYPLYQWLRRKAGTTQDESYLMCLRDNGKLTLGMEFYSPPSTLGGANIGNYRLFVRGGILTDEIRVRTSWADYVFEDDYHLKPLSEVESFIKENKHLPNVPSARQVSEEGIQLGDMAKIQQEKIEELTLYIIEQNKRIDVQQTQIDKLQDSYNNLLETKRDEKF